MKEKEPKIGDFQPWVSMGYEKDIFDILAYDFELLHNRSFLVKSFAYAHGEIIYPENCEIWCYRIKWN